MAAGAAQHLRALDVSLAHVAVALLGGQKSPKEQEGKSPLDFDFQCEYKP